MVYSKGAGAGCMPVMIRSGIDEDKITSKRDVSLGVEDKFGVLCWLWGQTGIIRTAICNG